MKFNCRAETQSECERKIAWKYGECKQMLLIPENLEGVNFVGRRFRYENLQ